MGNGGEALMATAFTRSRGDMFTCRLEPSEIELLNSLADQVLQLLGEVVGASGADPLNALVEIADSSQMPQDLVLQRWFPDAYRDDPEAGSDFRRYTSADLARHKRAAASEILQGIPTDGVVRLTRAQAQLWGIGLNDMRLAIGTRLELDDTSQRQVHPDDPEAAMYGVYDWLTWLQESLVQCLLP